MHKGSELLTEGLLKGGALHASKVVIMSNNADLGHKVRPAVHHLSFSITNMNHHNQVLADSHAINTYRLLMDMLRSERGGEEAKWPFVLVALGALFISCKYHCPSNTIECRTC